MSFPKLFPDLTEDKSSSECLQLMIDGLKHAGFYGQSDEESEESDEQNTMSRFRPKLTKAQRKRIQREKMQQQRQKATTFSVKITTESRLYALIFEGVAYPEGESFPIEKQYDIQLSKDWYWGPCDMFSHPTKESTDGWRQILHREGNGTTRNAWKMVITPEWFNESPAMYIWRCFKTI